MEPLYDPPIAKRRGRSASMSTSTAPPPSYSSRRQSFSSIPANTTKPALALSDDEAQRPKTRPLLDLEDPALDSSSSQDPEDAAADRKVMREGRQSKQQRLEDDPNYHATGDMEQFMAQLYDLTHTIDALENDIDEIVQLRNMICSLKPSEDIGQVSLQADLHSLSALTTNSGKRIVSLETWLLQLHKWSKDVKKLVKSGQAGETMKEVGEIKFQLANAKLDFADAMERIREGAWKEQERRERTRMWMARHIRSREPEIEDKDVKGLLKAAELGAADGVCESHVTSYAGLWALQNPFTELAELTHGMRFLHDDLDREIVDTVTGKNKPKRIIYVNGVYSKGPPKVEKSKRSSSSSSTKKVDASTSTSPSWFKSRLGLATTTRPARGGDDFDNKFRYIQAQMYASEKDLEYGFARQHLLDRMAFRKKMVIALLLVVIAALILFVSLATMRVPSDGVSWTSAALSDPSSTFEWGQEATATSPTVAVVPTTAAPVAQETLLTSVATQIDSASSMEYTASILPTSGNPDELVSSQSPLATSTRNVVQFSSPTPITQSLVSSPVNQVSAVATPVSEQTVHRQGIPTAQATQPVGGVTFTVDTQTNGATLVGLAGQQELVSI